MLYHYKSPGNYSFLYLLKFKGLARKESYVFLFRVFPEGLGLDGLGGADPNFKRMKSAEAITKNKRRAYGRERQRRPFANPETG
jgi:hypothetical protein